MKRDITKEFENLENAAEETISLCCTNCDAEWDGWFGVEEAFDKGWRATERNCYCPKCAKKKLKRKKRPNVTSRTRRPS